MFTVLLMLTDEQVEMLRRRELEAKTSNVNFEVVPIHLRAEGYERDVITVVGYVDVLDLRRENQALNRAVNAFKSGIVAVSKLEKTCEDSVDEAAAAKKREEDARAELSVVQQKLARVMGDVPDGGGAICANCRHMTGEHCYHPEHMERDWITGKQNTTPCKKHNAKGQCEVFAAKGVV